MHDTALCSRGTCSTWSRGIGGMRRRVTRMRVRELGMGYGGRRGLAEVEVVAVVLKLFTNLGRVETARSSGVSICTVVLVQQVN